MKFHAFVYSQKRQLNMGVRTGLLLCFLVILLYHANFEFAFAQDKQKNDVVRLKTDLMELRVVVTDKTGRVVDNLSKDDFQLTDNNRPQQISFFSVERVENTKAPDVDKKSETSIKANQTSLVSLGQPGRVVVLFVDTLHISSPALLFLKRNLRQFVDEQMTHRDVVALVTSNNMLGLMERYTQDKRLLRTAIDKLAPVQTPIRGTYFSPYLAAKVVRGDPEAIVLAQQIMEAENEIVLSVPTKAREILFDWNARRTALLSSLKAVCDSIGRMPGQRLMAVFSDGFSMMTPEGDSDTKDVQAAIDRAVRKGVVIYSLSTSGVEEGDPLFAGAPAPGYDPRTMATLHIYTVSARRDFEAGLNWLALDTGGKFISRRNDLNSALGKMVDDNRLYYLLAYYPPLENGGDNQAHKLKVRVAGHPEFIVRTQTGYLKFERAVEETRNEETRKADTSETKTIGVVARADCFGRGAVNPIVTLSAHIDASDIEYQLRDGFYDLGLEVTISVRDMKRKPVGEVSDVISMHHTPESVKLAKEKGYDYSKRVELEPGSYEISFQVKEVGKPNSSKATAWVDVPDLSRDKLTLSNLVLLNGPLRDEDVTVISDGARFARLSSGESLRVYRAGEQLAYGFYIFNGSTEAQNVLGGDVQITITTGSRVLYDSGWQSLSLRRPRVEKAGILVAGGMKLQNLNTGIYELYVRVRDGKKSQTAETSVSFAVTR
jgi:VWFA-related protein